MSTGAENAVRPWVYAWIMRRTASAPAASAIAAPANATAVGLGRCRAAVTAGAHRLEAAAVTTRPPSTRSPARRSRARLRPARRARGSPGRTPAESAGLRLDTQLRSRTSGSSRQMPPALTMSSRTPGHEASRRPFAHPAEMSTHGPWQRVAIGLEASSNARTKLRACSFCRTKSGPTNPPTIKSPS